MRIPKKVYDEEPDENFEPKPWIKEQSAKRIHELKKISVASNNYKGNALKGDSETEAVLAERIKAFINKTERGRSIRVDSFMENEACALLVDICCWLPKSPILRAFVNIVTVEVDKEPNIPMIGYCMEYPMYAPDYPCAYFLMLDRADKIRLFATETRLGRCVDLFEYTARGLNLYGLVWEKDLEETVECLLEEC